MNEIFFKNVKDMREAQKNYFKIRDTYWLSKSKELEKLVDDLIKMKESPKLDL